MKKLFYILSLAAVASLTVLSCQKEKEVNPREPSPAEEANCYGVYFPTQDASGDHVYNPTQDPVIEITVARTNDKGDITVPLKAVYSEDEIFVPETISFADGQSETTFKVRFDAAKEGVKYEAHFTIEGNDYASLYNSNPVGIDFSIMRVEMLYFLNPKTNEKALITWNQGWWGEVATGYLKYYEVDGIRTCFTETIDHLYNGTLTEAPGFWGYGADYEWTFYWYTKNNNYIRIPAVNTGYHHSTYDADIYALDYFYYNSDDPDDEAAFLKYAADNEDVVSYYDGNGGFFLSIRSYYMFGIGGWNPGAYDTIGIADGFVRVDYSFEVETDYSYEGVTPIYLETGVDVASIKYAVYEGELTATQVANKVAAIEDGTDKSIVFTDFTLDEEEAVKYATLELAPETTGVYTFVAVAYDGADKPAAQNSGSVVFKHIAAGDIEDYAVEVSVFTEDTPARYTSYHAYDSFAYGIAGEDLTDVHVAIFKLEDVAKDADAYFDAVKEDADGKYAVSEEVLDQVNGEGGYYTVATGMPAKTQLVVIVWATNGDMDDWAYATYTTEKLPYVWNKLGVGVYTEDVAGGLYGVGGVDVEANVYEEKNTPGLYMIDGFQQNYIATLFAAGAFGEGMVTASAADYEGVLWRNCELVIDATNPANVTIELQDYGICLVPDDGFIDGLTSLYKGEPFSVGTLENGVISFPTKKGLLCLLAGDGYYYANQDGAFKLVLPAAASAAPSAVGVSSRNIQDLSKSSFFQKREMQVFERDPKPVTVAAEVSYTRKDKSNSSKAVETETRLEVR